MELTRLSDLRALLEKYQIKPSKKKGQNFLVDKQILDKIVKAAELSSKDIVIEIGGGVGTLSQEIAKKVKKIAVLEMDKKLVEVLKENLYSSPEMVPKVKILEKNILKVPSIFSLIPKEQIQFASQVGYKLIGNLPYNVTGALFRKIHQEKIKPKLIIFLVQKEVAERICSKKTNLLSLVVQLFGQGKILVGKIPSLSFYPRPKVESAILEILPKTRRISKKKEEKLIKIAKICFSQKRKTILNSLYSASKSLGFSKKEIKDLLKKARIDPDIRPEDLDLKKWLTLSQKISF